MSPYITSSSGLINTSIPFHSNLSSTPLHQETFESKQSSVLDLYAVQWAMLTHTTSAHTWASRGLIRAPTNDSSGSNRLSSSSLSTTLGSSRLAVPPVSAQMNACWARLMMWPKHLSKLLWEEMINKEKKLSYQCRWELRNAWGIYTTHSRDKSI